MKEPASKPPLITPSASPPGSTTFYPLPYRISSTPSPSKRQTSSPIPVGVDQARHASALRLLENWAQLEARHTRGINEDDIVDLARGEVVKDRGVLRSLPRQEFGHFIDTDDVEPSDPGTGEGDTDDVEGDVGDTDFVTVEEHVGKAKARLKVPPVREMDPADALDLKEFMEAERRLRMIGGEEEDDDSLNLGDLTSDGEISAREEATDDPEYADRRWLGGLNVKNAPSTPRSASHISLENDSDDEFGAWKLDDANAVYRLPRPSEDISNQQLRTPPQSNVSITPDDISAAICDDYSPRTPSYRMSAASHVLQAREESMSSTPVPPKVDLRKLGRSSSQPRRSPVRKSASFSDIPKTKEQTRYTPKSLQTRALSRSSSSQTPMSDEPKEKSPLAKTQLEVVIPLQIHSKSSSPINRVANLHKEEHTTSSYNQYEASSSLGRDECGDATPPPPRGRRRTWRILSDEPTSPSDLRKSKATAKQFNSDAPSSSTINTVERCSSPIKSKKRKRSLTPDTPSAVDKTVYQGLSTTRLNTQNNPQDVLGATTLKTKGKARSKSRPRSESPDSSSDSDHPQCSRSRLSPRHPPSPDGRSDSYKYHPLPYMHHPSYPPPGRPAIDPTQDPRVQYILSQTMQQISYLWAQPLLPPSAHTIPTWMPYTPTHHHRGKFFSSSSSSSYSTPTQNLHSFPYMFDPNSSGGTLPPSSPGSSVPSSPVKTISGRTERVSSLVRRSQSRGRRVSFKLDKAEVTADELSETEDHVFNSGSVVNMPFIPSVGASNHSGTSSRRTRRDSNSSADDDKARRELRKSMSKAREEVSHEDDSSEVDNGAEPRHRRTGRAQTPGPSSSHPSSRPPHAKPSVSKPGRRKTPNH